MLKLTMRRLSTRIGVIWRKVEDSFCINAVKIISTRTTANRISVSNTTDYQDGAGAQTQRILSIVALAKYYEFSFVLNPINNVEIQPLDFINSEVSLASEIEDLNLWICKKFIVEKRDDFQGYKYVKNSRELFTAVFAQFLSGLFSKKSNISQLLIADAYFLTKLKPSVWQLVTPVIRQNDSKQDATISVAVHIHFRLSTFSPLGDRFIPIHYYERIMNGLTSDLSKNGRKIKFVIHTDFNNPVTDHRLFLAHADPQSLSYWISLGLLTTDLKVDTETISSARECLSQLLSGYDEVIYYEEGNWTSEWESMASADYLITSKSSFSFIGAILNPSGVIIAPKSWRPTLPHWTLEDI